MACPLSCSISLRARQLKAAQVSRHFAVSIGQFFCHPELGILVSHAHHQIAQSTEYCPSNTLRTERLLYIFCRIIGLSKVHVRSREAQPSKGLSRRLTLG